MLIRLILTAIVLTHVSCYNKKHVSTTSEDNTISAALPHIIIYKTKQNYNNNIPVSLNDDKTIIVNFPHPSDLFFNGELSTPIELSDGYLLDRRGININVAFTSYTYADYSKFSEPPGIEELKRSIIDKDPLIELFNCGVRADKLMIDSLNYVIQNNFTNSIKLK